MQRRAFLQHGGLALGAGLLPLTSRAEGGDERPSKPPEAGEWEAVRAEFALEPGRAHLASFYLASHPREVREAVERHRRGLDASPIEYLHEHTRAQERGLRRAAADYLEADPDALAITDSTTMGLGLVYGGLRVGPGQELLTTTHDHIVTHQALRYVSERTGAPLRFAALYDAPEEARADAIVERFERALAPATRVVALTWVHSGTGVKLPIRRLADVLARVNAEREPARRALLVVDGVHGLGIEDETVASLACDAFVAGTHKWIFGPRGTGLVWAKPAAWAATSPTICTFDPVWREGEPEDMPPAAFMTPGGFKAFEHRWAVTEAFRFHLRLGKRAVAERIHALNRRCKEALLELPRVRVATPMADELSAGIVCFDVDGMDPYAVVGRLGEQGVVASVTPGFYDPLHARLAPSLVTLERDVDRAVAAVAAL